MGPQMHKQGRNIYLNHLICDAPIYEKTYGVCSKKNHR